VGSRARTVLAELQSLTPPDCLRPDTIIEVGVLYVLDEPSIGLHPSNVDGLLGVIRSLLRDGNSVVTVDHDVQVLREADWLIEIGPGSGQGKLADRVRELCPDGADAALELVGGPALPDILRAVRRGGMVCFTGSLSGEWIIPDFNPFTVIPSGVRLTVYGGEATDLPPAVFDHQLRAIAEGRLKPAVAKVYHGLDQVPQAHIDLEAGRTPGKHVVVLD
jgi:NADPH:quinone reductase-like Zn-dependent oxidoreductase